MDPVAATRILCRAFWGSLYGNIRLYYAAGGKGTRAEKPAARTACGGYRLAGRQAGVRIVSKRGTQG
jgi:hypothetical protein